MQFYAVLGLITAEFCLLKKCDRGLRTPLLVRKEHRQRSARPGIRVFCVGRVPVLYPPLTPLVRYSIIRSPLRKSIRSASGACATIMFRHCEERFVRRSNLINKYENLQIIRFPERLLTCTGRRCKCRPLRGLAMTN
jgi:hypothetical protein